MQKGFPKRKNHRLKDFSYGVGPVYFITVCTSGKRPYFLSSNAAGVIEEEIDFRREKNEALIYCQCIMPDHFHMLMSLQASAGKGLSNWMAAFKRHTAKVADERLNIKPLWQRNFYDHVVRKEESLVAIAQYILHNPVRKGMVAHWEQYRYSKLGDRLPV